MPRVAVSRTALPPLAQAPIELRRCLARVGPVWAQDIEAHAQAVLDAYAPLLRAAPKGGIEVLRDRRYGEDPRQVLDLYVPARASEPERGRDLPVVVFVHGGAYVRGERDLTPEFHSNVPTWFARQRCLGVNLEYRLAPVAPYPSGARDIAAAVAWLHANVARHGGDPGRILLVGHSAGGTHVASYAFDEAARGTSELLVAGQVLVSARVRADARPENPNAAGVRAYFGDDPGRYEERSPISHAAGSRVPTMIALAEFENPLLDTYGLDLFHRMSRTPPPALRFVRLDGHNHTSIVAHFNSGEEVLGMEILDFLESIPARLPASVRG